MGKCIDFAAATFDLPDSLRASADAAVLIAGSFESARSCGVAQINNVGWPFGVVRGSCVTTVYGFSHELAHILGANHDRAQKKLTAGAASYNHGYHVPPHENREMTIMAYGRTPGKWKVLPYYSNPRLQHRSRPLGAEGKEDNARTLVDNGPFFQVVGDESIKCNGKCTAYQHTLFKLTNFLSYMCFADQLACTTTGKGTCVFPFFSEGAWHYGCLEDRNPDGSTFHWCATELDANNATTVWGRCKQNCPRSKHRGTLY